MQGVIGRLLLMIVLLVIGAVLWTTGQVERRLADGHKQLATLQYAAPAEQYDDIEGSMRVVGRVPSTGDEMRDDARQQKAASEYWQAQYGTLKPERDSSGALVEHDPEILFLSANAAYHSALQDSDRAQVVKGLEGVMKNYVDVLKNTPGHADAAYNYEFVVRKRNMLSQPKTATAVKPDAPATIHGRPGAPPKDADLAQFKIVVPKRSEEREDPNAGKGDVKTRKG